MKLHSLVHVTWVDSTSENRWCSESGMIDELDTCESIGWLVRETKEYLTIAGHRSSMASWHGVMTIPRCSVKKIRRVRR
jgi:hypothetical protein